MFKGINGVCGIKICLYYHGSSTVLESDVFCSYRTQRSKLSHYQRPIGPSLAARGQNTRHLSGVGTSRSALLLTVRVESGIARTKSNNGPRSWLCSSLLRSRHFCCCRTQNHTTWTHACTHYCRGHLPASAWPPTVVCLVWVGEGGVTGAGGGGGGVGGRFWQERPSPASLKPSLHAHR